MIKRSNVYQNDFSYPLARILNISSKGLDKRASVELKKEGSSPLLEKIAELEPKEGHTPVLMVPMGAQEVYGPNRNADGWPRQKCVKYAKNGKKVVIDSGLIENHPTFVTNAYIYKEHNNKDPKQASGIIALSNYNPKVDRVEVVSQVDSDKWAEELGVIEKYGMTGVSMAANVSEDLCSICGNSAKSPSDYCSHIKLAKNSVLSDGSQVIMVNNNPTFIDLSGVKEPADRIGYGLGTVSVQV